MRQRARTGLSWQSSTLIEPFDGNRDEFERLRRFFFPMFSGGELVVPGVATYVDVARDALRLGAPCAALAKNLYEWTRLHIGSLPVDGRTTIHRITGVAKCPEFEVTVRRQRLSSSKGFFLVRRCGRQNVGEVVEKALRKKLGKLVAAGAHKRILLLERQDWRLDERDILAEMRQRRAQWPDLDQVDEVWIVKTTAESPADLTDFIDFKLYDEHGLIVRSFAFVNGTLFDHSRDGVPMPIQ